MSCCDFEIQLDLLVRAWAVRLNCADEVEALDEALEMRWCG